MSEQTIDGAELLGRVRNWLGRFIGVTGEEDLDILTLWAAHTHLVEVTGTTPRLLITSPVPGSGKTTVLEHLGRLCLAPVQMSSVSSPALITRLLAERLRTVLIDEADRALNPKNEGIGEILGVLNSGYKQGATRPVLVPSKEHGWVSNELPTYSPVAMAGNGPNLPEDTLQRCIPIGLLPSDEVEESDWEEIEMDAADLGLALKEWASQFLDSAPPKVTLPEQVKARAKERWRPLKRVAVLAGGRWPEVTDALAADDVQRVEDERESGLSADRPHIVLVQHLADIWPAETAFMPTKEIVEQLRWEHPDMWGEHSSFGKALTERRFGVMLNRNYRVTSTRQTNTGPRGHAYATMARIWKRLGVKAPTPPTDEPLPMRSAHPAQAADPAQNGHAESQNSHESRLSRPQGEGVEVSGSGSPDLQKVLELMPINASDLANQLGWNVQKSALLIQQAIEMEAQK